MITKSDIISRILNNRTEVLQSESDVFAPANIALCKYWGKRDTELNLPVTDSLSISLGNLGSRCRLRICDTAVDDVRLNGQPLDAGHPFVVRLVRFLDLFRTGQKRHFHVDTVNTIPTAAGFASSASGFASIVKALNALHGWELSGRELSILARLGSGSASRSLWQGFVHWHAGTAADGMDSFAEPLAEAWPDLRIGLLVISDARKETGSTEAMLRTVETSILYRSWPQQVAADMQTLCNAIRDRDFESLGSAAETNALAMHATMMAARPPVLYWKSESLAAIQRVWAARKDGLRVYFTMDAGPNLKLIYRDSDREAVEACFPALINPSSTTVTA